MIINHNQESDSQENSMQDMPLGFSFTLATNQEAMASFANMSESEKRQVIEAARSIETKHEMQSFVDSIGKLT
ncbi:MAG: hypothetical protein HFI75_00150 [Lachnospiraceae bacterium]|nr:hypothetical protein [Lachnospiraceae bacterium]